MKAPPPKRPSASGYGVESRICRRLAGWVRTSVTAVWNHAPHPSPQHSGWDPRHAFSLPARLARVEALTLIFGLRRARDPIYNVRGLSQLGRRRDSCIGDGQPSGQAIIGTRLRRQVDFQYTALAVAAADLNDQIDRLFRIFDYLAM